MMQTLIFSDYLVILASICGIAIFIYSGMKILDIIQLLPKESKTRMYWLYALVLIVLFALGYLFSIIAIMMDQKDLLNSITPIIYIFGAIFVFIVVLVSY